MPLLEIDRRAFIASLGGAAAVASMDHEARADALEHYAEETLDELVAQNPSGSLNDRSYTSRKRLLIWFSTCAGA